MLSYCVSLRSAFRVVISVTIFGSSFPPVVCKRADVLILRYLCLFVHSGVKHILCCVLFCFSSSCVPDVASFSGMSIFFIAH